ncbi:MAG: prolyl oligopeptidase family serine peptidase [Vogesella sp.]|nr:prolyl oligopeptidase family serine peptidase [Vogesella sp.]
MLTISGRPVLLHVPRSYQPGQPMPLLLALHGGGGSSDFMANDRHYGLISHSEQAGYLLALPNGAGALGNKLGTWNAGRCCGKARDEAVNDVAFARAVVAWVQQRYTVTAGRVYAVGMSNGGMMAYRLACEAADLFAGIASVAGTDNTLACQPSRPVAVLHIHARNDDHVLFNGGAGPGAFRDES